MDTGKLTKFVDFREIPVPEALLQLKVSPEVLDRDVADLGNRFATIETVSDGIKAGDIVVIKTEAPIDADPNGADYRHEAQAASGEVQINVGKGFYDKEFEQSLLGKKTGDTVTLPKRGQGKPGVIAEIKRIVPAEVTDDLAKKAGFNDLNAYRDHKRKEHENRDKRKKLDGIVSFIIKELREKCEFEDVEEADKDRLISRAFAEKDGVEFNREGYEAMVAKYVAEGMDEKQLRERMPYEDYLKFAPDNYITQCIQEYFADKFKAVIL